MNEGSPIDAKHIHSMSAMLRGVIQALVDDPDSVSVQAEAREGATALHVQVASSDVGKVIGKQGRTARALRTIVSAASMKLHHRFEVNIHECHLPEDHPDPP